MLKIVVDANIFISASMNPGKPEELVRRWLQGEFHLLYPHKLIEELRRAPYKRRLVGKLLPADVDYLISVIEQQGIFVDQVGTIPTVCKDTPDNFYLACAAAASADYLVTGDGGILDVGEYLGTKIVTVAQFLTLLII